MNFKLTANIISKIEKRLDVNSIRLKGLMVWPLIRLAVDRQIFLPDKNFTRGKSSGSSIIRLQTRPDQFQFLRPYGDTDILFYSLASHHIDRISGKFIDRFVDPMIDIVRDKHDFLKAEMLSREGLEKLPRYEPTLFIEPPHYSNPAHSSSGDKNIAIDHFDELKGALLDVAGMEIDQELFIEQAQIIEQYARYFKEMLTEIQPKIVFVACYYTLMNMALIRACKRLGITTVDIQHGILGRYHVLYTHWTKIPPKGYELVPDFFWMWGEKERYEIERWQPPGCIHHQAVTGGNRIAATWIEGSKVPLEEEKPFFEGLERYEKVVLVSLQWVIPVPPHLIEAIKGAPKDWLWLMRLHPINREDSEPKITDLMRQQGIENYEIRWATGSPLYRLLQYSDYHVTCCSSVCYEALAFHVPTVIIDPVGLDFFEDEIKTGIFSYALNRDSLIDAIRKDHLKESGIDTAEFIDTRRKTAETALYTISRHAHLIHQESSHIERAVSNAGMRKDKDTLTSTALALGQEGVHLLKAGKFDLALESIEQALGIYRKNHDIHYARAVALKGLGRTEEAIEAARLTLSIKGDHEGARELIQSSGGTIQDDFSSFESDSPGHGKALAKSFNQVGEGLFTRGDAEGAVKKFHRAIELDADFSIPHNNLGVIYWQTGETRKALGHFIKALEMDPDNRETTLNCGDVFLSLGNIEDTIMVYSSYLKRNPDDEIISSAFENIINPL